MAIKLRVKFFYYLISSRPGCSNTPKIPRLRRWVDQRVELFAFADNVRPHISRSISNQVVCCGRTRQGPTQSGAINPAWDRTRRGEATRVDRHRPLMKSIRSRAVRRAKPSAETDTNSGDLRNSASCVGSPGNTSHDQCTYMRREYM